MAENLRVARVVFYSLFSKIFVFSHKKDRFKNLPELLEIIEKAEIDENFRASSRRIREAILSNEESVILEYDRLFHAPPNPIRNTISFYSEGYDRGVSALNIKKLLHKSDIRRDEEKFRESEDNFGFLFTLMAEFIRSDNDELAEEIFKNYINLYTDEFIKAIYNHENSDIFKDAAILLDGFMDLERIFYGEAMAQTLTNLKVIGGLSRSERIRREKNRAMKNRKEGEKNAKQKA